MKMLAIAAVLLAATAAFAQNEDLGADTDPTRPVLYSVRNEYYDLVGGQWQNVTLLRVDRATLQQAKLPGEIKGVILRADIPFTTASDGSNSTFGLGDAYAQAFVAPHISGPDFMAVGMGLIAPTASDDRLGRGKWIAAPALVPVRFFPKSGFAFVKFQDWWGFAGDSNRRAVHYFTITPAYLRRISRLWWAYADAESNTNWESDGATSYKAGLLVGRMLTARSGMSLKVELPFGANQAGNWTVKAVFFVTRY